MCFCPEKTNLSDLAQRFEPATERPPHERGARTLPLCYPDIRSLFTWTYPKIKLKVNKLTIQIMCTVLLTQILYNLLTSSLKTRALYAQCFLLSVANVFEQGEYRCLSAGLAIKPKSHEFGYSVVFSNYFSIFLIRNCCIYVQW